MLLHVFPIELVFAAQTVSFSRNIMSYICLGIPIVTMQRYSLSSLVISSQLFVDTRCMRTTRTKITSVSKPIAIISVGPYTVLLDL
jgi:hypothetical protein